MYHRPLRRLRRYNARRLRDSAAVLEAAAPATTAPGASEQPDAMLDTLSNFSAEAGFIGLFIASFLAATILPGGSEVVLVAVIAKYPDAVLHAVAIATLGNTLGGTTSYLIGRLIPNKAQHKAVIYLHKYGYWALLFSWLPLVGDALCVAAGWLRFNPWLSLLLFAIGKLFRYVLVAGGWTWIERVVLPLFGIAL
jgi:membrane protein YqaA with SNARE-associated domain